jgi:Signal transduction histidine kinase
MMATEDAVSPTGSRSAAMTDSRIPILIWNVLVYAATMFLQLYTGEFQAIPLLFSTGLIALYAALHWHSPTLTSRRPWIYFLLQSLLIYSASYLVEKGSPALLIGFYSVLIGQSTGVYFERAKLTAVSVLCYALFCIALAVTGWTEGLALLIPIFLLMNVVVVSYGVLFFRQVHARLRTQSFLRELEQTHRRVEELTLANERQRMARDLHDTLAQGLAALLMRLEAIDAHLDSGNPQRAREIVATAMLRARQTLTEARQVIDDLRLNSEEEVLFIDQVRDTVERLTDNQKIEVSLHAPSSLRPPRLLHEHSLSIIGESIANAVKHASASHIRLEIVQDREMDLLRIEVEDDGIGLNPEAIGSRSGRYGLIGMRERVRLLGGTLRIDSEPNQGTTITVEVPYREGDDE